MFPETLKTTIELTADAKSYVIRGGNVRSCSLELGQCELSGRVTFWVTTDEGRTDELASHVLAGDLLEVRVELTSERATEDEAPPAVIVAKGYATETAITETSYAHLGGKLLRREYTIGFADPATVLWRQHHPYMLTAEASLADVLASTGVPRVSLDVTASDATKKRGFVCLPLGDGGASFYDFVIDYARSTGAVFGLDYDEGTYYLADEKPKLPKPGRVRAADIASWSVRVPRTGRSKARVLNASAQSATTKEVERTSAADGVVEDRLLRTPITANIDACTELLKACVRKPEPELEVEFARFPSAPLTPGHSVAPQQEFFANALYLAAQTFRVAQVSFAAETSSEDTDDHRETDLQEYQVSLRARWERASDKVCRLPNASMPAYPILVEGRVQCAAGQPGDRNYMTHEDDRTSELYYKVLIPLWNQEIRVPFQPQFMPGHFYAPAYKDSRILVALHRYEAELVQYLDWGTNVRMTNDSQGNALLLGKNATSETTLKHHYVDNKPVFLLERVFNGDVEVMRMEEGTLVLQTSEDKSLKTEEERFDCVMEVAGAQEKVKAAAQGSVDEMTAAFDSAKGALKSDADAATEKTSGALDAMTATIAGKAAQAKTELEAAAKKLAEKTAAMSTKATETIAWLKAKVKL